MIKLQNVSKYYYQKGMISSGINNVDLAFSLGEFVAITGESGSGKSTLLNVIAGLDTYEEGEMYVNGEETSYFSSVEIENYRKKYIGNIFQSFNLVNSYSVYKNVELVLLLRGKKKRDVKKFILQIIDYVGLTKFKRTKVSKLSGGQKQRVAIARVLAMDVPIILADEPTGNLDETSANEIIQLLNNIAKDKLVIVVTHNYDMVAPFITRRVTMADGTVFEDQVIKPSIINDQAIILKPKNLKPLNTMRLAVRNTFNLLPKLILLLAVFMVLVGGILSQYASYKYQNKVGFDQGWNNYFQNTSDKRLVLQRNDRTAFSESDYGTITGLPGIKYIVKEDYFLDIYVGLVVNDYYTGGNLQDILNFEGSLDFGRMPESSNEVIIAIPTYDTYIIDNINMFLNTPGRLDIWQLGNSNPANNIIVVGASISKEMRGTIYVDNAILTPIKSGIYRSTSKLSTLLNGKTYDNQDNYPYNNLMPSKRVPSGQVYVSEMMNGYCKNYNCLKTNIKTTVKNLYFEDVFRGKITKVLKVKQVAKYFGVSNNDEYASTFFVNPDDYNKLFDKGDFQISVFVEDADQASKVKTKLEALDFKALYIKDTLFNYSDQYNIYVNIFRTVTVVGVLGVLILICYFITWLIIKSRNIYYSIVRILGGSKANVRQLIGIELLVVANMSYGVFIGFLELVRRQIIPISYFDTALKYMTILDYAIVYGLLILVAALISRQVSASLFKQSAMSSYREVL